MYSQRLDDINTIRKVVSNINGCKENDILYSIDILNADETQIIFKNHSFNLYGYSYDFCIKYHNDVLNKYDMVLSFGETYQPEIANKLAKKLIDDSIGKLKIDKLNIGSILEIKIRLEDDLTNNIQDSFKIILNKKIKGILIELLSICNIDY